MFTSNGNIDRKPGVGTYLYDAARPHALAGIKDGAAGSGLTGIEQEIIYMAFNKVSCVQHHGGNNDRYEIQYGPNRQRIKTTYYANGKRRYDRYYFGTYELDVCPEGHRTHTDYIYTPGGLTAIFKRTLVSEALYYVTTDHMGSIQAITDAEGELQAEYRYEPWGGRVLISGDNALTDRGYTGHEHLEPLGLINMNGRIYDPTLARFLSPDPYVQAPDFTQGFNRYSYCLNNPFKYTDPSGEFFTWSVHNGGFSIGFNLTPMGIPVGGGFNFGWSSGGSVGIYTEVGYRIGGTGFGFGATVTQSFDYSFGTNSWYSTTSASIYASFGPFNVGIGGSSSYSFKYQEWYWGWNANIGVGLGGSYNSSLGLNIGYGSGGFSFGLGGSYNPWAQRPSYHNPNVMSDALAQLSEATKDIRERLAQDVPLLTVENETYERPFDLPEIEIIGERYIITYYQDALLYEGAPYLMGGMSCDGLDCSGLVNLATGHETRVWNTSSGNPPGNWTELSIPTTSQKDFVSNIREGYLLVWPSKHAAFSGGGDRLFHAHGKKGTPTSYTAQGYKSPNGAGLNWWIENKGYPNVYKQRR